MIASNTSPVKQEQLQGLNIPTLLTPTYTYIYLHIPTYTYIYLHIPKFCSIE